jgi:hypothetical protein
MTLEETKEFFAAYRDAFNQLDGDAVTALWHLPSALSNSQPGEDFARLTLWTDDASLRANWYALCDVYRESGAASWEFELREHVEMGEHHAFARVHWWLQREGGDVLQEFDTGYNLMRTPKGPRVVLCTAYQEAIPTRRTPDVAQ